MSLRCGIDKSSVGNVEFVEMRDQKGIPKVFFFMAASAAVAIGIAYAWVTVAFFTGHASYQQDAARIEPAMQLATNLIGAQCALCGLVVVLTVVRWFANLNRGDFAMELVFSVGSFALPFIEFSLMVLALFIRRPVTA